MLRNLNLEGRNMHSSKKYTRLFFFIPAELSQTHRLTINATGLLFSTCNFLIVLPFSEDQTDKICDTVIRALKV